MKHTLDAAPPSGNVEHVTGDEWRTAIGPYNRTQIVLRRDGDRYELVLCDHVNPDCKFWFHAISLNKIKTLADTIDELLAKAEDKSK